MINPPYEECDIDVIERRLTHGLPLTHEQSRWLYSLASCCEIEVKKRCKTCDGTTTIENGTDVLMGCRDCEGTKTSREVLDDARQAAVGELDYTLACAIRNLIAEFDDKKEPAFRSDALDWVAGLASRFEQAVCDLAIARSKELFDNADVTIENMKVAADNVLDSNADDWFEDVQ